MIRRSTAGSAPSTSSWHGADGCVLNASISSAYASRGFAAAASACMQRVVAAGAAAWCVRIGATSSKLSSSMRNSDGTPSGTSIAARLEKSLAARSARAASVSSAASAVIVQN